MNADHALDVASAAARAAGRVLRQHRHDFEIALKEDRANLVTSADLRSQEAVVGVIADAFPHHAIVGEEGTVGDERAEHVWYVDPLDGTTNYAHGLPFYCVSIALRTRGSTVCGVVFDPHHMDLYAALRGGGATCNTEPLQVSATDRLDQALVVAMAQSSDLAVIEEFAALYAHLMSLTRGVRHLGSPALSLCAVARGRLDAYVERYMDPWDISAGQLILEEAGGRLTDFGGSPVDSAAFTNVAASNGLIHQALIDVLPRTSIRPTGARPL